MRSLVKHTNKIIVFLGLCIICIHGLSYLYGFHPFFIWSWVVVIFLTIFGYVFSGLSLILIIYLIIKKESFFKLGIVWLISITILVFVPGYYSEVAGALTAFHLSGAEKVKSDATLLIQNCEQSLDKQKDCGYISEYPSAIKHVNPEMVYVSDTFIVIGKLGFIHPDGFMIFSNGDIPTESMHIKKLDEDLYWTYGN